MTRFWVCLLAAILFACSSSKPLDFGAREPLSITTANGSTLNFSVEVARTEKQLWTGLRWRKHLATDEGMLFDLGVAQTAYFTMSDTYLPLDMLFIGRNGRIRKIAADRQPGQKGPFSSDVAVLGVLELNGGTAERLGIRVGDRVSHPMFPSD